MPRWRPLIPRRYHRIAYLAMAGFAVIGAAGAVINGDWWIAVALGAVAVAAAMVAARRG